MNQMDRHGSAVRTIRSKRGVLISLSVTLLCLVLLYLYSSISSTQAALRLTNSALSDMDTLNSRYDMAASGLRTILATEGVNVTYSGNNISFKENTSTLRAYALDSSRYVRFVQTDGLRGAVSFNITEISRSAFHVYPQNISVDNFNGRMTITPDSPAAAAMLSGYDVQIKLNTTTPILNWTQQSVLVQSDPNAIYFHLAVQGTDGVVSYAGYLNRFLNSTALLMTGQNTTLATIQLGAGSAPAYLKVYYTTDFQLETILWLNQSSRVELGQDAIMVDMGNGLTKNGKVIVGES